MPMYAPAERTIVGTIGTRAPTCSQRARLTKSSRLRRPTACAAPIGVPKERFASEKGMGNEKINAFTRG